MDWLALVERITYAAGYLRWPAAVTLVVLLGWIALSHKRRERFDPTKVMIVTAIMAVLLAISYRPTKRHLIEAIYGRSGQKPPDYVPIDPRLANDPKHAEIDRWLDPPPKRRVPHVLHAAGRLRW